MTSEHSIGSHVKADKTDRISSDFVQKQLEPLSIKLFHSRKVMCKNNQQLFCITTQD